MCYAAMVEKDIRKLERKYNAKIEYDAFLDSFKQRADYSQLILDGEKGFKPPKVMPGLEWEFLKDPSSKVEKAIAREIERYWDLEESRLQTEYKFQVDRVAAAEEKLKKKSTLKAQNDVRVGTDKAEKAKKAIDRLRKKPKADFESWIYPKDFFPAVYNDNGKLLIRLFRYLLRPNGQPVEFDQTHSGAYNAKQENLTRIQEWKDLFGTQHGIMLVLKYIEREDEELMPLRVAGGKTKEYLFSPGYEMEVPLIWDCWKDPKKKEPELWSAAGITCPASPEAIKRHVRRGLTPLKEEYVTSWLNPQPELRSQYKEQLKHHRSEKIKFELVA